MLLPRPRGVILAAMSLRGWRCQSDFTYCSWSTYNNYRTNNYNTKYNTKYRNTKHNDTPRTTQCTASCSTCTALTFHSLRHTGSRGCLQERDALRTPPRHSQTCECLNVALGPSRSRPLDDRVAWRMRPRKVCARCDFGEVNLHGSSSHCVSAEGEPPCVS